VPGVNEDSLRLIRLRYRGRCRTCSIVVAAGTEAFHDRDSRTITCPACISAGTVPQAPDRGIAGASAQLMHDRRAAQREFEVRRARPRLGGLVLALTEEPQAIRAWEQGAVGEQKVGAILDRLSGDRARVLHDRAIPGRRANIDHLFIAPAGVFVIDTKRYRGRPQLQVTGGLLRPRVETLMVGRRARHELVEGVLRQTAIVRRALADAGHSAVPVAGVLCFVDADWPLIGGSFTTRGVHVLRPKKIARHAFRDDALDPGQIAVVYGFLGSYFRSACAIPPG
jgi:hypothetical protein